MALHAWLCRDPAPPIHLFVPRQHFTPRLVLTIEFPVVRARGASRQAMHRIARAGVQLASARRFAQSELEVYRRRPGHSNLSPAAPAAGACCSDVLKGRLERTHISATGMFASLPSVVNHGFGYHLRCANDAHNCNVELQRWQVTHSASLS